LRNSLFDKVFLFGTLSILSSPVLAADGDLFPAKSGSWWTYKTTDWKGTVGEIKYRLVGLKKEKNGDCSFRLVSNNAAGPTTKYYTKRGEKTYLTRIDVGGKSVSSNTFTPPKLVIDNKIRTGSIWQWNSTNIDSGKPSERWQVFPIEKVKVPAGEFACLRIGGLKVGGQQVLYQSRMFCPNIGLVKSADSTGTEKSFEELSSYHVK